MRFLSYVFGPTLYIEYGKGSSQMYSAKGIEMVCDHLFSTVSMMRNIGYYSSPFILTFLYQRDFFVGESLTSFAKFAASIGFTLAVSLCLRGIGRMHSRAYTKLIEALELAKSLKSEEGKQLYRQFDFDFRYWDVDFDVNTVTAKMKNEIQISGTGARFLSNASFNKFVAYFAMHTFGIRMIYPGSIKLLQSHMHPMLILGRAKLIEEQNGKRYKIKTFDLNEIDAIFVDNRPKEENGKTLIICSEGNTGFYEVGIMGTPLSLKYSVLGWNHPGFGCSTGKPYPEQDKHAIEGVIQFALKKLGFAIHDIILYGWSIGGYTTIWGASCFPDVKGAILDATFDDILHLAQPRISTSLANVIKIAIRNYCNLNLRELIPHYNGPLLLIRRTEDEIIAKNGNISTNRGNYLAIDILKYRYPYIFETPQVIRIIQILSKPMRTLRTIDTMCLRRLIAYVSENGKTFPMLIGVEYTDEAKLQMATFLLRRHLRDYKSTHCTPLPVEYFNMPWDIAIEQEFVAF